MQQLDTPVCILGVLLFIGEYVRAEVLLLLSSLPITCLYTLLG